MTGPGVPERASTHERFWRHEMRGGYGYVEYVPCLVIDDKPGRPTLGIEVERKDGTKVKRYVKRANVVSRCA